MNTIHSNGENDKSLSEGLDELKHSYRRLPKDEPPELLDQAILNKARRAVEKKPHWMKFSWLHGLTTAAVFVLAFSVIINQREQVPVIEEEMSTKLPELRQREKSARTQASDIQPDTWVDDLNTKKEKSSGFFQTLPTSAPVRDTVQNSASEEVPSPKELEIQPPGEYRVILPSKDNSVDEDAVMAGHPTKELAEDKSELMLDSLRETADQKPARPAALSEPALKEFEARVKSASDAQQKLLEIIKLKRSGDDKWKTELELFRTDYPDHPIPDELKQ